MYFMQLPQKSVPASPDESHSKLSKKLVLIKTNFIISLSMHTKTLNSGMHLTGTHLLWPSKKITYFHDLNSKIIRERKSNI